MANIVPDFLSPEQLTAFRELLEARNFDLTAAKESSLKGYFKDVVSTNDDFIDGINAPQVDRYRSVEIPPFGDTYTPTSVKPKEIGAARVLLKYRDIPPDQKIFHPSTGTIIDYRNPTFDEFTILGELGDRTFTRPVQYIPSANPESIDASFTKSLWGSEDSKIRQFAEDPAHLVPRDWWLARPPLPTNYDPRAWEARALAQENRMRHFEGLSNILRNIDTADDRANIWEYPIGHNDLLFDKPDTVLGALNRYHEETKTREEYLRAAAARRAQFNRQLMIGMRKLEDPEFSEKLDKVKQSYRDARKYLSSVTTEVSVPPTADNPAPFNTIVVPDYFMSNPENSRVGTERELVRTWAGPAILDDGAANAWNEMSSANKAGVLPAIQTMVDYNKFIKGTNLSEGLLDAGDFSKFLPLEEQLKNPFTKGGYLGSNFGPQMEAVYNKAVEQDRLFKLANKRLTDRYLIDPKFRKAVNSFIPNTLRTPTANAVGGALSMAGQIIDATDPDYMNRNYRMTDPLSVRPFYDLVLNGFSEDARRSYERLVSSPEYVERNPLSSMVGQAVRGNPEYLKAFFQAYNPF